MTFATRTLAVIVSVLGTLAPVTFAEARPSIAALQSQITAQQAQIATLQTQVVPNLAGYVTMDVSTPSRPVLRVAGANLQVVNGLGSTESINGLGNIIVGYDEATGLIGRPAVCSLGQYLDQPSCTGGGGIWAVEHKSGSHNIVVGPYNRYARFGGLVAGYGNTINADEASVSGGRTNIASGSYASVSGGSNNIASGYGSSITAGLGNAASGDSSSVTGGLYNGASYNYDSIGGGQFNVASGGASTVSGGQNRTATASYSWAAGGLSQNN